MITYVARLSYHRPFASSRFNLEAEAKQIIEDLQQRNIEVAIISGDHEQPTERLAQTLGIDRYFAETLPEQKASLVAELQQAGKKSALWAMALMMPSPRK